LKGSLNPIHGLTIHTFLFLRKTLLLNKQWNCYVKTSSSIKYFLWLTSFIFYLPQKLSSFIFLYFSKIVYIHTCIFHCIIIYIHRNFNHCRYLFLHFKKKNLLGTGGYWILFRLFALFMILWVKYVFNFRPCIK